MAAALRDELKKRQQAWMREREVEISRSGVQAKLQKENQLVTDDVLLDQVTEKISKRIEERLRSKFEEQATRLGPTERKDVLQRLESFLSSDLHNYVCNICYELMTPPHRAPIMLFPCGHTFCKTCIARQAAMKDCPYCRESIKSYAENRCLRQLIERFVAERAKLETGEVDSLDQVFRPTQSEHQQGARSDDRPRLRLADEGERRRLQQRYQTEYQVKAMRHEILLNELEDTREHLSALARRRSSVTATRELLEGEKAKVQAELQRAQEQLRLVEQHISTHVEKDVMLECEEVDTQSKVVSAPHISLFTPQVATMGRSARRPNRALNQVMAPRQPASRSRTYDEGPASPSSACVPTATATFPRKLLEMIESEPQVISWTDHGLSFYIRDQDALVNELLPKYFRHTKLTSFQRQLNLYGFRRITKGPDVGAYFHPQFRRDRPQLVNSMKRLPGQGATATAKFLPLYYKDVETVISNGEYPPSPRSALSEDGSSMGGDDQGADEHMEQLGLAGGDVSDDGTEATRLSPSLLPTYGMHARFEPPHPPSLSLVAPRAIPTSMFASCPLRHDVVSVSSNSSACPSPQPLASLPLPPGPVVVPHASALPMVPALPVATLTSSASSSAATHCDASSALQQLETLRPVQGCMKRGSSSGSEMWHADPALQDDLAALTTDLELDFDLDEVFELMEAEAQYGGGSSGVVGGGSGCGGVMMMMDAPQTPVHHHYEPAAFMMSAPVAGMMNVTLGMGGWSVMSGGMLQQPQYYFPVESQMVLDRPSVCVPVVGPITAA